MLPIDLHTVMKEMNIYTKLLIASAFFCLIFFLLWIKCEKNERERFMNFNRKTVPVVALEKIKSPTMLAISFDEFFHIDTIIIRNQSGKALLTLSTEFVSFEDESMYDYSDFQSERHPFQMSIDEMRATCNLPEKDERGWAG